MPIYDFECQCCRISFDKLVKMDTQEIVCDRCKVGVAVRVVGLKAPEFRLKGNDWYLNDSRKERSKGKGRSRSGGYGDV